MENWLKNKTSYDSSCLVLELTAEDNSFEFNQMISSALSSAVSDLHRIEERINENETTLKTLVPECDKLDYILAASSGALCGIFDVFLVGKPGKSPLGEITDKWFEERVKGFAKLCGWNSPKNPSVNSAIGYLERKFRVPYDQRGAGDAGKMVFGLTPKNHHFKSLGHNPTLLGLFFSILDQFQNSSHFVTGKIQITLEYADDLFELRGKSIVAKFFCAFANWFVHLVSDVSGSSGGSGRGMGIPSPLWCWMNDIIAIKEKLRIPVTEFDNKINELALKIFNKGFDLRFQTTQTIPVIVNELIVRFFYCVRRALHFFSVTPKGSRTVSKLWKTCEPFSNATVKRMLTVAHGSFCLVDIGDATIRGFATGNVVEFFLRLNISGVGRFAISLYGEVRRGIKQNKENQSIYFTRREKMIIEYYIDGLKRLSEKYDDLFTKQLIDSMNSSELFIQVFEKSVQFAEMRNVPEDKIIRTKKDIDDYFQRREQGV